MTGSDPNIEASVAAVATANQNYRDAVAAQMPEALELNSDNPFLGVSEVDCSKLGPYELPGKNIATPAYHQQKFSNLHAQYSAQLDQYKEDYVNLVNQPAQDAEFKFNLTSHDGQLAAIQQSLLSTSQAMYGARTALQADEILLGQDIQSLYNHINCLEQEIAPLKAAIRRLVDQTASAKGKLGDARNEYNASLLSTWLMGIICVGGAAVVVSTYKGIP